MIPQILASNPSDPLRSAHAHFIAGRLDEAAAACGRALASQPADGYALHLMGLIAARQGNLAQAAQSLIKAAQAQPTAATHPADLGRILGRMGRWEEALKSFHRAVDLGDLSSATHSDMGVAMHMIGQLTQAAQTYAKAAALDPASAAPQRNLANVLLELGRADEALTAMRAVVSLCPADAAAHSDLLLAVHYSAGFAPAAVLDETRRWADQHALPLYPRHVRIAHAPDPARKFRIGYVSPDYRLHPAGLLLKAVLPAHDRREFDVFCYSAVRAPDELTPQFRQFCDGWRDISQLDDEQAADAVRADKIDLLIDMAGHTAHNRLKLFARRPAPVQAAWFGYPDSTGLQTMDWRITDAHADPPGAIGANATESLLRLPGIAWCYPPPTDAPPPGPLPARAAGIVTFACLNRLPKITPRMLELWARIMAALPNSRLLLLGGSAANDAGLRERLTRIFANAGVDFSRVELVGRLIQHEYLRLHQRIDIALDCYPYNGAVTSCDALWMGVPLVSLAGNTYVSRQGASILACLGMSEWLAASEEQYMRTAIGAANDLARVAGLRSTLRERMLASILCNVQAFTRELENAYRQALMVAPAN
ncbi:MAG TPA: tetratricopeptide repeat protein [Tepidisphaeraceae bacterium]|nr:tetratricopeptide repeat protein [Tepidisphaeraceae bacterium]